MKLSDREAFLGIVIGLAELKGKQLSPEGLELYWNAIQQQRWSIEDFREAANLLVSTCQFMPEPKDFHDLRRATRATKGEAWAAVRQHLKGAYRNGDGLTPEIDAVVRILGGYRTLAMMNEEDLTWQERRFAEHYDEAADIAEKREPLRLPESIRKLLGPLN